MFNEDEDWSDEHGTQVQRKSVLRNTQQANSSTNVKVNNNNSVWLPDASKLYRYIRDRLYFHNTCNDICTSTSPHCKETFYLSRNYII